MLDTHGAIRLNFTLDYLVDKDTHLVDVLDGGLSLYHSVVMATHVPYTVGHIDGDLFDRVAYVEDLSDSLIGEDKLVMLEGLIGEGIEIVTTDSVIRATDMKKYIVICKHNDRYYPVAIKDPMFGDLSMSHTKRYLGPLW